MREQPQNERYFNDAGIEVNPTHTPVPELCLSCSKYKNSDQREQVLCRLNRVDQQNEGVFLCFAYLPTAPNIDRDKVLRKLCEKAGVDYPEPDSTSEENDEDIIFFSSGIDKS